VCDDNVIAVTFIAVNVTPNQTEPVSRLALASYIITVTLRIPVASAMNSYPDQIHIRQHAVAVELL
jgi:hypothetical protein